MLFGDRRADHHLVDVANDGLGSRLRGQRREPSERGGPGDQQTQRRGREVVDGEVVRCDVVVRLEQRNVVTANQHLQVRCGHLAPRRRVGAERRAAWARGRGVRDSLRRGGDVSAVVDREAVIGSSLVRGSLHQTRGDLVLQPPFGSHEIDRYRIRAGSVRYDKSGVEGIVDPPVEQCRYGPHHVFEHARGELRHGHVAHGDEIPALTPWRWNGSDTHDLNLGIQQVDMAPQRPGIGRSWDRAEGAVDPYEADSIRFDESHPSEVVPVGERESRFGTEGPRTVRHPADRVVAGRRSG